MSAMNTGKQASRDQSVEPLVRLGVNGCRCVGSTSAGRDPMLQRLMQCRQGGQR